MQIKNMYKIHNLNVAQGRSRNAGNNTFYETEEQALSAARSYVERDPYAAMVIYKATCVVQQAQRPVEILSIEHDGCTIPMR